MSRLSGRPGVARTVLLVALCLPSIACAGHSAHTADARKALDAGQPKKALALYNKQLKVKSGADLPDKIKGDVALYVLDRSMIQQELGAFEDSSRDLELADKEVEMLDLSHKTIDDIGKYMFSDDVVPYQAPPYEKLLVNTMNMVNYLSRGDLSGARVEARRFSVMQDYLQKSKYAAPSMSAPGSYLAGFIFERSGQPDVALRYYDEALAYGEFGTLLGPVRKLTGGSEERLQHIKKLLLNHSAASGETPPSGAGDAGEAATLGELLVVINYGRVPAKVARRIPIGLALTYGALYLTPRMTSLAGEVAAQGVVTWINYPELEKTTRTYGTPTLKVDGAWQALDGALHVDEEARRAYDKVKGRVIAAAITRTVTRFVAGQGARVAAQAATNDQLVGTLFSLGTQAALTAADTPDTRSWSTLPGRIAVCRVPLAPGKHEVEVTAHGAKRRVSVNLAPGGWQVVSLTVLH